MKNLLWIFLLIFLQKSFSQKKENDSLNVEKLEEVVLRNKNKVKSKNPNTDVIFFSNEDLKKAVTIMGETDPIKLIQLSSGVQTGAEGQSGFMVRGGNPSMNLVYLDDIYLHNISHIGGFFPLLNSDYIKNLSFYKGGFNAEDGGRLSSITKINSKTSLGEETTMGSIGLLVAKLTTTINLKDWNTKILVSGRRTYLEAINALMGASVLGEGKGYYFYDYLLKVETRINQKNKIAFTNFNTKDAYESHEEVKKLNLDWKNSLLGVSWSYNSFSNFKNILSISSSDFKLTNTTDDFPFNYAFSSKYAIWSLKNTSSLVLKNHSLDFGFAVNKIKNTPKDVRADILGETQIDIQNDNDSDLLENSIFFQDLWKLKENISLKGGVRLTNYQLNSNGNFNSWYVEPRVSLHYEFKDSQAIKLSYQYLRQYLHQARINTFSMPVEYYIPTNNNLPFQKSNQVSAGYYFDSKNISGEISTYYKHINDYSEFKNGALNNLFNSDLYNDVVIGRLNSYGIETHLEARFKKINGSINYTFSRTKAKFSEINDGKLFPVVFDRPHNLNVALSYKLTDRLSLNGLFVFTSGQNYTPIKDIRIVNEFLVLNFGDKNSARFPSYHRLDVGVNYQFKKRRNFTSSLDFTIYNLYNRQNTFYINHVVDGSIEENNFTINSFYESLFPIIPSLTWSFSF
ncbi:TonB-dependent receptor plug domain-containing protein [Wenyingzhuangia sp. IMCC45574]